MDFGGASTRAVAVPPGWQVTKNVTTKADEDNAVPGRIATAPLDLAVGHCDPRTSLNVCCRRPSFVSSRVSVMMATY
jgi:hypothetical protein